MTDAASDFVRIRRMSRIIFVVILLSMPAAVARAEIAPDITYEYFPVQYIQGKSFQSMVRLSTPLRDANNHRPLANISWRFFYRNALFDQPTIGVCKLKEVEVGCTCLIRLPKLEGGDENVRKQFEVFVEESRKHELEHCRIAVKHAGHLKTAFTAVKQNDCDKIGKKMREVYDQIYDECRAEQKRFDDLEYGYKHYHRLETIDKMREAGFHIKPPTDGHFIPTVDKNFKPNFKTVTEDEKSLKQGGIYKDENGVWRNY